MNATITLTWSVLNLCYFCLLSNVVKRKGIDRKAFKAVLDLFWQEAESGRHIRHTFVYVRVNLFPSTFSFIITISFLSLNVHFYSSTSRNCTRKIMATLDVFRNTNGWGNLDYNFIRLFFTTFTEFQLWKLGGTVWRNGSNIKDLAVVWSWSVTSMLLLASLNGVIL